MRKLSIGFLIIVIALTASLYYLSENIGDILYDNSTPAKDLITATHTVEEFENWKRRTSNMGDPASLWEFLCTFKVECLRKTPQGYYAVLFLEDGMRAYSFFGADLRVSHLRAPYYVCLDFFKKSDLDQFLAAFECDGKITLSSIANSDVSEEFLGMPFNSPVAIARIVQEGVVLMTFEHEDPRQPEYLVSSEFISNESWEVIIENITEQDLDYASEIPPMAMFVPYILEIDKTT